MLCWWVKMMTNDKNAEYGRSPVKSSWEMAGETTISCFLGI